MEPHRQLQHPPTVPCILLFPDTGDWPKPGWTQPPASLRQLLGHSPAGTAAQAGSTPSHIPGTCCWATQLQVCPTISPCAGGDFSPQQKSHPRAHSKAPLPGQHHPRSRKHWEQGQASVSCVLQAHGWDQTWCWVSSAWFCDLAGETPNALPALHGKLLPPQPQGSPPETRSGRDPRPSSATLCQERSTQKVTGDIPKALKPWGEVWGAAVGCLWLSWDTQLTH